MHTFLHNIINEDTKNTHKKRKRIYSDDRFAPNKETAPVNAPNWTKSRYDGTLKKSIKNYGNLSPQEKDIDENESSDDDNDDEEDEDDDGDDETDNNDNSVKEGNIEQDEQDEQEKRTERRSRSLVLAQYDSDYDGI